MYSYWIELQPIIQQQSQDVTQKWWVQTYGRLQHNVCVYDGLISSAVVPLVHSSTSTYLPQHTLSVPAVAPNSMWQITHQLRSILERFPIAMVTKYKLLSAHNLLQKSVQLITEVWNLQCGYQRGKNLTSYKCTQSLCIDLLYHSYAQVTYR